MVSPKTMSPFQAFSPIDASVPPEVTVSSSSATVIEFSNCNFASFDRLVPVAGVPSAVPSPPASSTTNEPPVIDVLPVKELLAAKTVTPLPPLTRSPAPEIASWIRVVPDVVVNDRSWPFRSIAPWTENVPLPELPIKALSVSWTSRPKVLSEPFDVTPADSFTALPEIS